MALQEEFQSQGNFLFKYRSNLPLIFLLAGLLVFVLNFTSFSFLDNLDLTGDAYKFVCVAVCFLGLGIRIYAVGHTPKNTSGRNTEGQLADELNTSGIYSTVRHPLYLGNFFMWLGISMLNQNLWFNVSFVLAYWLYYERIMYAEEQFLRGKFGKIYTDWAEKTPAFIPSFKNFTTPKLPFSWKKILKKEKNGLAAIFILVYLFEAVQKYIDYGEIPTVGNLWFNLMILSVIIYVILRFIKTNTKLFEEEGR